MKTSKENTKNVILSLYGRSTHNTILNHIDIEYLEHCIILIGENTEPLWNMVLNNRSKAESVAKNLICSTINLDLRLNDYSTVCTYKQVKDILKNEFNYNIDSLVTSLAEWVETQRKEFN